MSFKTSDIRCCSCSQMIAIEEQIIPTRPWCSIIRQKCACGFNVRVLGGRVDPEKSRSRSTMSLKYDDKPFGVS